MWILAPTSLQLYQEVWLMRWARTQSEAGSRWLSSNLHTVALSLGNSPLQFHKEWKTNKQTKRLTGWWAQAQKATLKWDLGGGGFYAAFAWIDKDRPTNRGTSQTYRGPGTTQQNQINIYSEARLNSSHINCLAAAGLHYREFCFSSILKHARLPTKPDEAVGTFREYTSLPLHQRIP